MPPATTLSTAILAGFHLSVRSGSFVIIYTNLFDGFLIFTVETPLTAEWVVSFDFLCERNITVISKVIAFLYDTG